VALHSRNAVSRHDPALAHGLSGEIRYVLTRKPRNMMKSLAITLALGLLHLGSIRGFEWDTGQKWLLYLGLWVISVVMSGSVCINAMSFDAIRVRDTGGARTPGVCPPPRPPAPEGWAEVAGASEVAGLSSPPPAAAHQGLDSCQPRSLQAAVGASTSSSAGDAAYSTAPDPQIITAGMEEEDFALPAKPSRAEGRLMTTMKSPGTSDLSI
jgi:hypothetical protein